jgi:anti-anti-sigma factor
MAQGFPARRGRRTPSPEAEMEVPFDQLQVAVSEPRSGVVVVAPVGEVDVATSTMLRHAVSDALDSKPRCVAIDLAGLTFCGSTGLVVLLEAQQAAEASGVGFGTFGGRRIVQRVLQITGLGPALRHCDDLDAVLAAQENG